MTIADLVADLRAPTPSAAAELVVERKDEIVRRLENGRRQLARTLRGRLALSRAHLSAAARSEVLLGFPRRVGRAARVRLAEPRRPGHAPASPAGGVRRAARRGPPGPRGLFPGRGAAPPPRPDREPAVARCSRRSGAGSSAGAPGCRSTRAVSTRSRRLSVLARGYAVAYREGATAPLTVGRAGRGRRAPPRPPPRGRARRSSATAAARRPPARSSPSGEEPA